MKKKTGLIGCKDLFKVVEGTLMHLEDRDKDYHAMNYYVIEMRYLFWGFVVKAWKGVSFSGYKHSKSSTIAAKHYIIFCKLY